MQTYSTNAYTAQKDYLKARHGSFGKAMHMRYGYSTISYSVSTHENITIVGSLWLTEWYIFGCSVEPLQGSNILLPWRSYFHVFVSSTRLYNPKQKNKKKLRITNRHMLKHCANGKIQVTNRPRSIYHKNKIKEDQFSNYGWWCMRM